MNVKVPASVGGPSHLTPLHLTQNNWNSLLGSRNPITWL